MKLVVLTAICAAAIVAATASHAGTLVWHLGQVTYDTAWANTDLLPAEAGTTARFAYRPGTPMPGAVDGKPVWYHGMVVTAAVDCANRQSKRLRIDRYSRKPEKMSSTEVSEDWRAFSPGDPMDAALIAACDIGSSKPGKSYKGDDVAVLKWLGKQF